MMIVAVLALGLGGGYWYGHKSGLAQGFTKGTAEEQTRQESLRLQVVRAAEREAAKVVNVFDQVTTNPFSKAPANPYERIKINPFD